MLASRRIKASHYETKHFFKARGMSHISWLLLIDVEMAFRVVEAGNRITVTIYYHGSVIISFVAKVVVVGLVAIGIGWSLNRTINNLYLLIALQCRAVNEPQWGEGM